MAKKGQKFRMWTTKQKEEIIKPVLNYEKTLNEVARENKINKGLISTWISKYNENGIKGLENKRKPGNPMAKYFVKKHFESREEQLEYENMKLRIENERLKKGYLVKGDGIFVTFKK